MKIAKNEGMKTIERETIAQLPLDCLVKEGKSQRDRIAKDVMEFLFAKLPDKASLHPDFYLDDGTKCWIKKFHPPRKDENGDYIYGFDVKLGEGSPLSHLEFSVRCSGWERNLTAPT